MFVQQKKIDNVLDINVQQQKIDNILGINVWATVENRGCLRYKCLYSSEENL